MEFDQWVVYFIVINIALYCPGPMSLFLMSTGINHGYRHSVFCVAGASTAYFIQMLIIALGFSIIFKKFPMVFLGIKSVGAIYFIYLGIKQLLKIKSKFFHEKSETVKKIKNKNLFFKGLLIGLLNPKALILFVALFSQFMSYDHVGTEQYFILMATFLICQFFSSSFYSVVGWRFFNSLEGNKIFFFKTILGVLLIFFGVLLFLTKIPS